MFGLSPINIIRRQVSKFHYSKFQVFKGASVRHRSEGIGGGFPVDCVTLHMPTLPLPHPTFYNYHRHSVHRPFHHYLPTRHPPKFHPVSLSSATVCSVSLGDNSWIICMPAPPMVIHHGLQALSTALVGEMHNSRILAPLPWPTR